MAFAPRPTIVVEGIVYHIGERKEFGAQTLKGYVVAVQTPAGDDSGVGGYLEVRYSLGQVLPSVGEEVRIFAEYNAWAMPATENTPAKNGVVLTAVSGVLAAQSVS